MFSLQYHFHYNCLIEWKYHFFYLGVTQGEQDFELKEKQSYLTLKILNKIINVSKYFTEDDEETKRKKRI